MLDYALYWFPCSPISIYAELIQLQKVFMKLAMKPCLVRLQIFAHRWGIILFIYLFSLPFSLVLNSKWCPLYFLKLSWQKRTSHFKLSVYTDSKIQELMINAPIHSHNSSHLSNLIKHWVMIWYMFKQSQDWFNMKN